MSITESLSGLRWIRLHIARIAVREIHGKVVGFLLRSTDDHPRFAEVTLGVSWRMRQRHEHFSGLATMLPHVVLDYRVLAHKPVLVSQPV